MEEMIVNAIDTLNAVGSIAIEMNCYGLMLFVLVGFSCGVLTGARRR